MIKISITHALILFIVFILVYVSIAEIFTVLFRLTGLTEEKARFQVISMLTNSGFTTAESELITSSKIRRKLARLTMLFGYSFTVTIVSIIVNIFLALTKAQLEHLWETAIVILISFFILYMLKNFNFIKKNFDNLIEKIGNKIMFGDKSNVIVILDTYGSNVMAEVKFTVIPNELKDIPLGKSNLSQNYNLKIILIKRDGIMSTQINGDTIIQENDSVVVFGDYKIMRSLFENPNT